MPSIPSLGVCENCHGLGNSFRSKELYLYCATCVKHVRSQQCEVQDRLNKLSDRRAAKTPENLTESQLTALFSTLDRDATLKVVLASRSVSGQISKEVVAAKVVKTFDGYVAFVDGVAIGATSPEKNGQAKLICGVVGDFQKPDSHGVSASDLQKVEKRPLLTDEDGEGLCPGPSKCRNPVCPERHTKTRDLVVLNEMKEKNPFQHVLDKWDPSGKTVFQESGKQEKKSQIAEKDIETLYENFSSESTMSEDEESEENDEDQEYEEEEEGEQEEEEEDQN